MASRFVLPFADVGDGISPADGAKLFFFATGTSTPRNTYSDNALTIANSNPVIADAEGVFSDIFLLSGDYKVQLKDKNDVLIWEADPVSGSASSSDVSQTFQSKASMLSSANGGVIQVGDVVETIGYFGGWAASANPPKGGNHYELVDAGSAGARPAEDGGSVIHVTGGSGGLYLKGLFLDGQINIEQFGADPSGVSDSISAIAKTFAYASLSGADVYAGIGIFRITQAIDEAALAEPGVTGIGRLIGASFAYFTHFGASSDVPGSTDYSALGSRVTVIKCDGCNLIGAVDTPSTVNANAIGTWKGLKNIFAWGVNGAKIGCYYIPKDIVIENSTFVDFEWYGIATRNGITHKVTSVGFRNCGWNKAQAGVYHDPAPANQEDRYTYDSGCAMKFIANETPQNYTKIEIVAWGSSATRRMTTCEFSNIFITASNPYLTTGSGMRGIQAAGLRSTTFNNVGSYFGSYFAACSDDTVNSFHAETLSTNGTTSGDATPISVVLQDCAMVWNEAVRTHGIQDLNSGDSIVGGWRNLITDKGKLVAGTIETLVASKTAIKNNFGTKTTTAVTSGTNTVDFVDVIPDGFVGFVTVGATYNSNKVNNPVACFLVANNAVASRAFQVASDPSTGGFSSEITSAAIVNGNDLRLTLAFGASWAGGEIFNVNAALLGSDMTP